jgi:hypothetical protein
VEVEVVVDVAVAVTVVAGGSVASWLGEMGSDASAIGVPVVAVVQALKRKKTISRTGR